MKPCEVANITDVSAEIKESINRVSNKFNENVWTPCTLKMEAASSTETPVTTHLTTRYHISEDMNLNP